MGVGAFVRVAGVGAMLLCVVRDFPGKIRYTGLFEVLCFTRRSCLIGCKGMLVRSSFVTLGCNPTPACVCEILRTMGRGPARRDFGSFLTKVRIRRRGVCTSTGPSVGCVSNSSGHYLSTTVAGCGSASPCSLSSLSRSLT